MEKNELTDGRFAKILSVANGMTISKTAASKFVGGKSRLYRLIESGVIRMEKPTNKQNGKWFCNFRDVITNVQPNY